jgi:6-phosphofructokinase 1
VIFEKLQQLGVRYFFYNGGNDSAETAHILATIAAEKKYDIRIFHIPKTIDNDLRETDHCPGFASAAKYVAQSFMGNNMDNYSLPGVKIDVVMGRNAGWLTAAAGLAKTDVLDGPHLVYVPERPVTLQQFCGDILAVYEKYGRALVAVSEGLKTPDGKLILEGQIKETDSHGNLQLSGSGMLGDFLVEQVKKAYGKKLRIRSDTLGYAQRSFHGVRSEIDAQEAWDVGSAAVKYAVSGVQSGSVIIQRKSDKPYKSAIALTDLSKVAKVTKDLPENFMNKEGNNVTAAFLEYIRPLVGVLPATGVLKRSMI